MKLVILAAALVLPGSSAPPASSASLAPPAAPGAWEPPVSADRSDRMNLYRQKPGCRSIPDQVAGADRRYDGARLDRLPQGHTVLAVERHVDGCREVVLLRDERRRRR